MFGLSKLLMVQRFSADQTHVRMTRVIHLKVREQPVRLRLFTNLPQCPLLLIVGSL